MDKEIDMSMESRPSVKEGGSAASAQQPTQILQREHGDQNTTSASPVVKVQPRMKQDASPTQTVPEKHPNVAAAPTPAPASRVPNKASDVVARGKQPLSGPTGDQKAENASSSMTAAQKAAHGIGMARSGGASIPVAVVQPSAQQKPAKYVQWILDIF